MKPLMRRLGAVLILIAILPRPVGAHPMGNFTISHYTAIRCEADAIVLRYRIDMAEIPTFQEISSLKLAPGQSVIAALLPDKVAELTAAQTLNLDGLPKTLTVISSDAALNPGAGGLSTLLITIDYRVPFDRTSERHTVEYTDRNFPNQTGWREIIAVADGGAVVESSVPTTDRSAQLTAYPTDALVVPPQITTARIIFQQPTAPVIQPSTVSAPPSSRVRDRFAELMHPGPLSTGVVLFSLAVAVMLGGFHALSPGHGKTVVAAYLVGSRGTPMHAILLGVVVTITHTLGVFLLGVVVLFASRYVLPATIYPWLGAASGMMIVCVGSWQFIRRWAGLSVNAPMDDAHNHGPLGHSHTMPDRVTPRSLLALGISGGMVPCPSALVVLLSAVALHRIGFGLLLIVAFSLGLAMVLILIGLVMLYARSLAARLSLEGRWMLRLPLASSALIVVLGLAVVLRALAGKV